MIYFTYVQLKNDALDLNYSTDLFLIIQTQRTIFFKFDCNSNTGPLNGNFHLNNRVFILLFFFEIEGKKFNFSVFFAHRGRKSMKRHKNGKKR